MGHVQPFVAIVLGGESPSDAERLARAAGATAILRPGQPHPVPLHALDAVIDLGTPHDGEPEQAVIDLSPASTTPDETIDLLAPGRSGAPDPAPPPAIAVVIDPAEVLEVSALVSAVHLVLDGLKQFDADSPGGCVVASRMVTDTLKLVDDAGVLVGTANRDEHRWVSAPLAGPLDLLAAVAGLAQTRDHEVDDASSPSIRPLLDALIRQGVKVKTVAI